MSNMINVSSGFQYSVNIEYDLNNDDKLKNFIPTKSALTLLEDILLSTNSLSTERSRILVGAYGKGKSHIMLMILSILMKRDLALFQKALPKIKEDKRLYQGVLNYYEQEKKILPVIITGSNTSLPQAFLLSLQRTLQVNGLSHIMPETNFDAAIAVINRWEDEFPETYNKFVELVDSNIDDFVDELKDYNNSAYKKFEKIYPLLTSGSSFNPFLGFDIVELYESVAKGISKEGYSGIFVVYDEFSKYLESNIGSTSVSDTKMLQDFAEKCNRSGNLQLHLMLISHKEISNYIDKLPKAKVDGWRGVSDRFLHVHLNNNFTQTYEIIASVIHHEDKSWNEFKKRFYKEFQSIRQRYAGHNIFLEELDSELNMIIEGCYPLHPVSTFILPRLSDKVAQNERTLFTFLSAEGKSTLPTYLEQIKNDEEFELLTPDIIFDYFEPQFKKEVYSDDMHNEYVLTKNILEKVDKSSLEGKIVKTISLIYLLEQFEKLAPTKNELMGIFSTQYTLNTIDKAINNLIEKELVVYVKRSNDFLQLKQSSGVDIRKEIQRTKEKLAPKLSIKDILNESNYDNYLYPSEYNDEKDMTRYFAFEFIEETEVRNNTNWKVKIESQDADGVIFAIIAQEDSINVSEKIIKETTTECDRIIFVVPKFSKNIADIANEYNAVKLLKAEATNDKILFNEYEIVYDDLQEVIISYINSFTHPELNEASYYYHGEKQCITRKAMLTGLLSSICYNTFPDTPVINNEAINRNEITSMANNSLKKIVSGLLHNEFEYNLGMTGTGQEVSIMRSTLIRTGVLVQDCTPIDLNLLPEDKLLANLLNEIKKFVVTAKRKKQVSFTELYKALMSPDNKIGVKKGIIPIYISVVFHVYKHEIIILDKYGQVPISADTILQINACPEKYSLEYLDWNPEKEQFVERLAALFSDNVKEAEKEVDLYEYVVNAMRRWYLSLPKYTKEVKHLIDGSTVDKRFIAMNKLLKSDIGNNEILFEKLPLAFNYGKDLSIGLVENIAAAKEYYDGMLTNLRKGLIHNVKEKFTLNNSIEQLDNMSLTSIIKDWCETLDPLVFEQLFTDGTERCLQLFSTITNDEFVFINRLAKLATELRIEDWSEDTYYRFNEELSKYKNTAEDFHSSGKEELLEMTDDYQLTFSNVDGGKVTKRFQHIEASKKGELLHNLIISDLESMGQAISEQEKRQILMDILKKMC